MWLGFKWKKITKTKCIHNKVLTVIKSVKTKKYSNKCNLISWPSEASVCFKRSFSEGFFILLCDVFKKCVFKTTQVLYFAKIALIPVVRIRFWSTTGSGALYLKRRELLKIYWINILDNFKACCFVSIILVDPDLGTVKKENPVYLSIMVSILYGNLENIAHAWRKEGLFGEKKSDLWLLWI